jgi:[NiFe] hydrogenase assembly HybE family chaperone
MSDSSVAEQRAAQVLAAFERIHREQMAGLPLLNPELAVAVSGFQEVQGRISGVVVTPWMMSLLLFPAAGDDWQALSLGAKESFSFPGGAYRCMQNVIDGLGPVMMHSVHSPMHAFPNQASALAEAALFITRALIPVAQASAADPVNEELLGRILRGEKVPEVEALVAAQAGAEASATA